MCDAKLRPFRPINETELACGNGLEEHTTHSSTLKDYAFPGSRTIMSWHEDDRRNFHGEWPGDCESKDCILPLNHRGIHAV